MSIREKWRKLPYWVKGGIIGALFWIIVDDVVVKLVSIIEDIFLIGDISVAIGTIFVTIIIILVEPLSSFGYWLSTTNACEICWNIYMSPFTIPLYFAFIGIIIGAIVDLIKKLRRPSKNI